MKREDGEQYPVGTRFLKRVPAWGECQGVITSYDDELDKYTVEYLSINMEEDLDGTQLFHDATIITNWDTHLLHEGQNVWAFQGKGKHPAVIQTINRSDESAFVKWTNSNTTGDVELNNLFPMFDTDSSGEQRTSRHGRRTRKVTDHYIHGGDKPFANEVGKMKRQLAFKEESPEVEVKVAATATNDDKHNIMLRQSRRKRMRTNFYIHGGDKALAKAITKQSNLRRPVVCKDESESSGDDKKPVPTHNQGVKKLGPMKKKMNSVKTLPKHIKEQPSEEEVPGPGWKFKNNHWVSPGIQLKFTPFQACKFEAYRVELGGDELKAYNKYQKYFGASVKSQIQETNMKHEDDELDPQFEDEYNKLWDYYMTKKVRTREEIPNGMTMRKRVVPCPLMRFKNVFRRLLHKKLIALDRSNKKNEIYRILKEVRLVFWLLVFSSFCSNLHLEPDTFEAIRS